MPGKIALAGGGNQNDSRLIDEVFTSWIEPSRKILYWPLALRGVRPFTECLKWMRAAFLPLNITNIEMWTDLSEHMGDELFEYAAVYIGGGNTYSLLAQCLESGFDRHLVDYVSRGGAIYGGSAGAAILGKDIGTVAHIDHNLINLKTTKGLNIVEGYAVWVHYQPDNDALIRAFVEKYNQSVLAISERAGIVLDHCEMRSVGFDPAYQFDEHGKRPL